MTMEDAILAPLPTAPPQPGIKRQPPPPIPPFLSVSFRLAVKLTVSEFKSGIDDSGTITGVGGAA
jgi:hypothetical protein